MFGLGLSEIVLILLVALVFLGPRRLPELAKTVGRGLREVRRASDELRRTIDLDGMLDDRGAPAARPRRDGGAVTTPPGAVEGAVARDAQTRDDAATGQPPGEQRTHAGDEGRDGLERSADGGGQPRRDAGQGAAEPLD